VTFRTCLCLITRPTPGSTAAGTAGGAGRQVLLGLKKRGFGAGRWVGLGGHVEPGEETVDAVVREVAEESGLIVAAPALSRAAWLNFVFPARPAWDQTAEVFVTSSFRGEPAESDELIPRWFPVGGLPLDGMWNDARYWLPVVLAGEQVAADITFADDCATVAAIVPAPHPSLTARASH